MALEDSDSQPGDVDLANEAAAAFGRAFTDGEVDQFLELLSPDVDFEVPSAMAETVLKLKGHAEVRRYLEQTAGEYEELRVESREISARGQGRFLMIGRWHGTARKTRSRFGTPMGAVFDFADGRVTRLLLVEEGAQAGD